MSTQHPQAIRALPAAGVLRTRASDADRDAAAALPGAAFAEGRLTADEHGERLSAAYAARTWQQLRQLTADLPGTAGATGRRASAQDSRRAGPVPAVPAADRVSPGWDRVVAAVPAPPGRGSGWPAGRGRGPAVTGGTACRALPWREGEHAQDR